MIKQKKKFIAVDIFSGCGGLSLGLKKAGIQIKAALEINPTAAKTYKINNPETDVIISDIRNISVKDFKQKVGIKNVELDILAGCPPCQGFSKIKKNTNGDDYRNNLVLEFLRFADELNPKVVLMENVPGIKNDFRFVKLLNKLKSKGYKCKWDVLNAADFGVPQRRKRFIFLASRVGEIQLPEKISTRKTVRETISKLESVAKTIDPLHKMHSKLSPRIKKLISEISKDGGSRSELGFNRQLPCHKRMHGFTDVYGRMKWDDVAPTLTCSCINPSKGRFIHPTKNRGLTLREAALLQSFPMSYHFPTNVGMMAIAKMIGDALPPKFAYRQGEHIVNHLKSV